MTPVDVERLRARGPDLIGVRFGSLVVQSRGDKRTNGAQIWTCLCDCGTTCVAESGRLLSGRKTTCGCRNIGFRKLGHTAGGKISPTFRTWQSMHARCTQPSNGAFKYYGARGVTVCERWRSFANFFDDMGERPPGMTLDRIDSSKGYEPDNCRWATAAQQSQNLSCNKLTADTARDIAERARAGEDMTALASEFGVTRCMVRAIRNGRRWATVVGKWRTP